MAAPNATIGEVTSLVTKGTTPTTLGRNFTSRGIGFIKAECISSDGGLIKEKQVYIDEETDQLLKRSRLQEDDVLFSIAGVIGRTALVQQSALPANTNQAIAILRPDTSRIIPRFLYYSVRARGFQDHSLGHVVQTAQANVSLGVLSAAPIWLPNLSTQRRIASILSAYDDLIENSQRRIKILESMARALYREWFVHFRFPGYENHPRVASPLGEIPEGWEVKKLGEVAEEIRRSVPKGLLEDPAPFVGLEHIPRRSLALDAWESTTELGSNKLEFKKGEVLFGKIRPYFHKVSVAPFDGLCSADTIVIRSRRPEHYGMVVGCVSSDDFVALATATSNGSKMPRASWSVLAEHQITIPSSTVGRQFSAIIEPAIAQMQTLVFQIQNLRRIRDLLLPRLLSGQIALDELEAT
jgi:type I restriction enzyme S subunit